MAQGKKRKLISAIAAVGVSAAILLTGTFAWQSISQEALNERVVEVNPGGRLHDDFDGTNKDIYVENFGDTPIFARVRLDEYMEIGAGAGLKDGDTDYESKKATPVKDGTDINDKSTWTTHIPGANNTDDPFHQYIEWEMGGSTTYMPTFNMNKDSLKADINGTYDGTDPDDDIHYDNYHAYTPGESKTGNEIYDNDDNTIDEGEDATDPENITTVQDQEHLAQTTLNGTVMTMAEWIAAGSQPGPYWVYDVDGWAYWAQAIEPDTATGLLLNGLTQLTDPSDNWYYAINVTGQFATAGDWGDEDSSTGFYEDGITDDALSLLNQAAGRGLTVKVSAAEDATTVKLGDTLQMSAQVMAGDLPHTNQKVTWSVSGKQDSGTTINSDGLLTIGANEYVGGTLTVQAISAVDNATLGTYTVTVVSPWDMSGVGSITPGSLQTATIDGIDWYVLARDGNKVLLFSKDILENRPFDQDSQRWQNSDIRTYLNSTWINGKATLNAHVVETTITTRPSTNSDSNTFDTTNDKVFLLSEADITGTVKRKAETAVAKDYTLGKDGVILSGWTAIASYNGAAGPWWTRSVGGFSTGVTNVDKIGGLTGDGSPQNAYGIRPALWINLAQ